LIILLALRAPLKIVFFRDCGVSVVLESSCISLYTAVLRAPLPCTHEKIRIFRDALKVFRKVRPIIQGAVKNNFAHPERYGMPEIFNTDQEFTNEAFTGAFKAYDIQISMDGERALGG